MSDMEPDEGKKSDAPRLDKPDAPRLDAADAPRLDAAEGDPDSSDS
jgi:hypothetical protein